MNKTILTAITAISLLISVSTSAFANIYTIRAENGKILGPTGISIDASGVVSSHDNDRDLSNYQAEIGYGAFPFLTVSGALEKEGSYERLLGKVYLSPIHKSEGYTLYAGYDFNHQKLAMYGASLWMNYKYLFAFLNVESDVNRWNNRSTTITPGFNLRLTNKVHLVGEAELDSDDLNANRLRAGINYHFAKKVVGKFIVEERNTWEDDTVFQTGISLEI